MLNHKAIYALYSNVVKIDDINAFDEQNNIVKIDLELVNSWVDPELYKYQRQQAYPSIVDQLDTLYHDGYDGWKEMITEVKNKYPKPE